MIIKVLKIKFNTLKPFHLRLRRHVINKNNRGLTMCFFFRLVWLASDARFNFLRLVFRNSIIILGVVRFLIYVYGIKS